MSNRIDLHPDHIKHNLAVEHISGALTGYRTVFGRDWITRFMTSVYVHFITEDTVALTLERANPVDPAQTFTVRYTLTDDDPDMP